MTRWEVSNDVDSAMYVAIPFRRVEIRAVVLRLDSRI